MSSDRSDHDLYDHDLYDVVLYGPTGVTGREVARYLANRAPDLGLTWAVAGRNRDKIEEQLELVDASGTPILIADSDDPDSISEMAKSAKVIANLVGPYSRHGEVVYRACLQHGTHQLDLTGEIGWVDEMRNLLADEADASDAKIVSTAGYEALPFDLVSLVAAEEMYRKFGGTVANIDLALTTTSTPPIRKAADAVSGGTWQSGIEEFRRGDMGGGLSIDLRPRRHGGTGAWLAPMVPSPFINPVVIERSAKIMRDDGLECFAPDFTYTEGMSTGRGMFGPVLAASASAGQLSASLFSRAPKMFRDPAADLLARFGPQAGDGPNPDRLDDWSYRIDARATGVSGNIIDVVAYGAGHPGYKSTATMVAEAALALADPSFVAPPRSGFLTPATALGTGVVERMALAGLEIRVR